MKIYKFSKFVTMNNFKWINAYKPVDIVWKLDHKENQILVFIMVTRHTSLRVA